MRQGNGYARQGRWDLAEEKWQDVASKYPSSKTAWNNLAISAVAKEDFELARDRIEHAKSFIPWDRARKTERWIDEKQHDYHRALGLPDREGGWLMPDPPARASLDEVPASRPWTSTNFPGGLPFPAPNRPVGLGGNG